MASNKPSYPHNGQSPELQLSFNAKVPASVHDCIHARILNRAASYPERTAVCAWDGDLTYAELHELSTRLAYQLVALGVGPEVVVPLCFEKSAWTVVAVMATLKAGGAFAMMDMTQPASRLESIVRQCAPKVVCVSETSSSICSGFAHAIVVGPSLRGRQFENGVLTLPEPDPGTPMYVCFTSGSTGKSKGIVITHSAFCSAIEQQIDVLGFDSNSRTYDFASYSFDVAVHNVMATLASGGCLCIPRQSDRSERLNESMRAMRCTVVNLTSSVAQLLRPELLPDLKTLILLGELAKQKDLAHLWGKMRIVNTYGPAECTPISTVNADATSLDALVRIGKGVGVLTWVVDADDATKLAAPGAVGELLLEGPVLARGYLHDPVKTDAAFVESPSWLTSLVGREGRLYKTGDLVRYHQDGHLSFVGRKDTQVKIRGQRVELGEVEHHVQECIATATKAVVELIIPGGEHDNATLAVFLTFKDGSIPASLVQVITKVSAGLDVLQPCQALEEMLSSRLPSYMVPSVFFRIRELPLSASAKLDRRRLRELGSILSVSELAKLQQTPQPAARAPQTEAELRLRDLWAQVLHLKAESISLDNSFFRLGGNSLTAMQLASVTRKAGAGLSVADIFRHPVLAAQALLKTMDDESVIPVIEPFSMLPSAHDTGNILSELSLLCRDVDATRIADAYACTPLQEGLLSLTIKNPGAYLSQLVLQLGENIQADAFRSAWEAVFLSTPILRTRIVQSSRGLVQVVCDEAVEWRHAEHLPTYLDEDVSQPMELGERLCRCALVGSGPGKPKIFVLTLHHTIYDGWTLSHLAERLCDSYLGKAMKNDVEFSTFVRHSLLQSSSADAESYWRSYLDGSEFAMFPSKPVASRVPEVKRTLEMKVAPNVQTEITMSTMIRAALAVVFSEYTESDDIIFGTVLSGRNAAISGIDEVLGPTIATVPVRVQVPRKLDITSFLHQVQRQAADMMAHEQTGLQHIARISDSCRIACAFQTLLVVQPQEDGLVGESLLGEWMTFSTERASSPYALAIDCLLTGDHVKVRATFDTSIINEWRMEGMMRQFGSVLTQLIYSPLGRTVGEIEMVPLEGLASIWQWNQSLPVTVDRCIHDIIKDQVLERPSAVAVSAWDGELTYRELWTASSRLRDQLFRFGVGVNTIVPLCFEKSKWAVVALLAVLKTGAAFTLLDSSLPEQRLNSIVGQVQAKLVLSSKMNQDLSSRLSDAVYTLDPNNLTIQDYQLVEEHPVHDPSALAYVVFTSGSTGVPKGCMITHSNIASAQYHQKEVLGFNAASRVVDFASYAFDASILSIVMALASGGCLCIPTDQDRMSNLPGCMTDLNVNTAVLTPSVSRLVRPEQVPSLHTLIFVGEAVLPKDVEPWWEKVRLINGYGPSECTPLATTNVGALNLDEVTYIGRGTGQVTWLVDPENYDNLVSPGCTGELLLEGPLVGPGYVGNLEQTNAAFVDSPKWLLQGIPDKVQGRRGRLYKTGDLAQYREDGSLMYMGRKDNQVKIRGQRVELGEVEQCVQKCMPRAKHVVAEVILPQGDSSSAVLVAFVQLDNEEMPNDMADGTTSGTVKSTVNGTADCKISHANGMANGMSTRTCHLSTLRVLPEDEALEDELAKHMATYMIPTVFFALVELPTTATGKINRRELRKLVGSLSEQELAEMQTSTQGKRQRPSLPMELHMQQIWAEVLKIRPETIGSNDSFFRLGGDSISAMRMVSEVARRFAVKLTVADAFRCPRLHQVAALMRSLERGTVMTIQPTEYSGPVEQSFAQTRLWFLDQLYPGLTWYLMPTAVRFRGPLCLEALGAALQAIECRHETLRTTFTSKGSANLQVVQPPKTRKLEAVEISSVDPDALDNALRQQYDTPFHLQTEPGWRVQVFRLGPQDHVLSVVMHHIISDGWSVDIFKRELSKFYTASTLGQHPLSSVPPLPIQYRDYSVWQKERIEEEQQRQLEYWVKQLATSQPAELFCDKPRPATLSGRAESLELCVQGSLFESLEGFCKEREVTPFVVLLAAFRAAHFRLTGAQDATIGSANANRDRAELKDVIGFFVNMQCIRIHIEDETFDDLVHRVHSTSVAALANQDIPFERIVSRLQRGGDRSRHPLVQMVFALHTQADLGMLSIPGCEAEQINLPPTSRFDLEFHFFQHSCGLRGEVLFSTDLFDSSTIQSMLLIFQQILQQGLSNPGERLVTMPLMNMDSYFDLKDAGLIEIQRNDYPRDSSIVDIFGERVVAHPDRVAVKDLVHRMTYAELARESDCLARWLAKKEFPAETLIGVYANRSCQTIIAFLGILKASLAYLPLDIKTPVARTQRILASIASRTIVLLGEDVSVPDDCLHVADFVRISCILDEQDTGGRVGTLPKPLSTSLAYVMHTSGSTSRPKGVMIEHRGIVRMALQGEAAGQPSPAACVAHMANIAFDLSTWEIYGALLNGGTLICIDATSVLDLDRVSKVFSQENIRAAILTPPLFKQYLVGCPSVISRLDIITIGGDRVDVEDVVKAKRLTKGFVINAYGPTENTGESTLYHVQTTDAGHFNNGVPIGRAIANSGAYVMDSELRLVPIGAVGELVVSGDGLARGYTDPQLDAGRFVFIEIKGEKVRAYRTGDRVRYRPIDHQLEFLGRIDYQVKIRGHRVELGEVEQALRAQNGVSDSAVVVQEQEGYDPELAAFVTARQIDDSDTEQEMEPSGNSQSEHVQLWQDVFNAGNYLDVGILQPENIGRDFFGWTSAYDGSSIERSELNEWLDDTIDTILDGQEAGHVLEIGSGTGMVLFNLANKGLKSYVGIEPNEDAIKLVTDVVRSSPSLCDKVHIHRGTAEDLPRLTTATSPNLIVVNSVTQYFPSQDYLLTMIRDMLRFDGVERLFFGDVRSKAIFREFRVTKALRLLGNGATKDEVQRKMAEIEDAEQELLVDPAFFTALPTLFPDFIKFVEILPKKMGAVNELSCYRYAAVVHVKSDKWDQTMVHNVKNDEWIDFIEKNLDKESLLQILRSSLTSSVTAVSNIPYSNTIFERVVLDSFSKDIFDEHAKDWISGIRDDVQRCSSLSVLDLVNLATETGYRVELSWSRQHSQRGGLDAVFHRYFAQNGADRVLVRFPTDHDGRRTQDLTTQPLKQSTFRDQLYKKLREQLPSYMIPRTITILDRMPLNENGKVDRRALADVTTKKSDTSSGTKQQPSTETEALLQRLWSDILGRAPASIGIDENFFQIGGDSIMAMRLVGAAHKAGLTLAVADVFQNPTIVRQSLLQAGNVAGHPEPVKPFTLYGVRWHERFRKEVADLCGLEPSNIEDVYPCTRLQEGLLSLSTKRKGDYVMRNILEIADEIDLARFQAAWEEVVLTAAAILRTRLVHHPELGLVQVLSTTGITWKRGTDLDEYLDGDRSELMESGSELCRFAVVESCTNTPRLFVLTIHHAVYDGWSLSLILELVREAYYAVKLPKETVARPQFNIFIKHISQTTDTDAEEYWTTYLADGEAANFPVLTSAREPVTDSLVESEIPMKARPRVTQATMIRGALGLILSQYSGSANITFGAVVSGRTVALPGIEKMIGPTIATIPVRVKTAPETSVIDYLEKLQKEATEMIPYEQTGLQRIARFDDSCHGACQFQTLLVVQPEQDEDFQAESEFGTWTTASQQKNFATYALTFECALAKNGILVKASFDSQIIDKWTVENLLHRLSFTIQRLSNANSHSSLKQIQTISDQDKVTIWNWNSEVPQTIERCLHSLIDETVQAQPHAPAVDAWDRTLTYNDLHHLAESLANHLCDFNIGPGVMVPLCFDKSSWMIVSMLAVLKTGAAFVPLDPTQTAERREGVITQCGAKTVLTSTSHSKTVERPGRTIIAVSSEMLASLSHSGPGATQSQLQHSFPSSIAYVLFTSGSTEQHKGVLMPHSAVSSSCLYHGHSLEFSNKTRSLRFSGQMFDGCLTEIFATLIFGGTICIPSEEDTLFDPAHAIDRMKVPSLETIILCDEKPSGNDFKRWLPSTAAFQAYGPAECIIYSSVHRVDDINGVSSCIGRSVGSVFWVVNQEDHNLLLPIGVYGELLIEGPVLPRGYLFDGVRTEASFIEDPPWLLEGTYSRPGRRGRLYKTGDLVKYNEDGTLTVVGRKDTQVKIRGQRFDLGVVEHHVRECLPFAGQVAAEIFERDGNADTAMLVALISSQVDSRSAGAEASQAHSTREEVVDASVMQLPADMNKTLSQRLPLFMMPSAYLRVSRFPLTTAGKLDRRRIRTMISTLSPQQLTDMCGGGSQRRKKLPAEKQIQDIWARLLNISPADIGLEDSFFQLGGDSLTAMKVAAEASRAGIKLSVADMFANPKLRDMAQASLRQKSSDLQVIRKAQSSGPIPQSFAQRRLWFLDQLYPGRTWYLIPIAVRLRGPLRLEALHAALSALVQRHETLRTTFKSEDGVDLQVAQPFKPTKLPVIAVDGEDGLRIALQQDQATTFDLATNPGWRVSVFTVDEEDAVLSIVMHHIISDGWSVDVLRGELAILYSAAIRRQHLESEQDLSTVLEPLPIQYRDFSAFEKQQENEGKLQRQLDYWVEKLETSQPAEFLCDKIRPATLSGNAQALPLSITGDLYESMQRFCKDHGVTPFVLLLSAFRIMHYRMTGSRDATVGIANASRSRPELRDIVGFFVNIQCIRTVVDEDSFVQFVNQVYQTTKDALSNEDVPFERIVSKLQRDRDVSRHPLAQVIFTLNSQPDLGQFSFEQLQVEALDSPITSRFDVEFHLFQKERGLEGEVVFSDDLFHRETMNAAISSFYQVLKEGLRNPNAPISSLPLIAPDSYQQLNAMGLLTIGKTEYPRESSIPDIIRQQVSAYPNRVAVKDSSTQYTYAELDEHSDKIAQWLGRRLCTPETIVGVYARRSCQTIAAFIGILKAGLAYLPIDVATPAIRIASMLSSAVDSQYVLVESDLPIPNISINTVNFARLSEILGQEHKTDPIIIPPPLATSLAYVMYTSGSTGKPKGVMIEHRSILRLVLDSNWMQYVPPGGAVTAHAANIAFDLSTWEVYTALLNGGTLVCIDASSVRDQKTVADIFRREKIQVAIFTPALLRQYILDCPSMFRNMDAVYVGGDRIDPQLASKMLRVIPGNMINGYGPTENTGASTFYHLEQGANYTNGVPIGRAVSNSGVHILDGQLNLLPLGAVGEIVVTGDGLARGYTDPLGDIGRFVDACIAGRQVRAYRTGDYGRYRPSDGEIEFFGRIDGQVKIRGHRVELEEIENAVRGHELVGEAVVIAQSQDDYDNVQLLGFVTGRSDKRLGESDEGEYSQVELWEQMFDQEVYGMADDIDPESAGHDFVGWKSAYDASDIDEAEMEEWLNDTIHAILNGGQLGNVLEIGTGTGMIMFNLVDKLQSYTGIELSQQAIDFVDKIAQKNPGLSRKVHIHKGTAVDVKELGNNCRPDVVIINSVAQYFPSREYLAKTIEDILGIESTKTIFFGDIRSFALYKEFQVTKATIGGVKLQNNELRQRMADIEYNEQELLVDPGFFTSLLSRMPDLIEHVEILPKKMKATNELSSYRYAAVIHVKGRDITQQRMVREITPSSWIDFREHKLDRGSLLELLRSSRGREVAISNICNDKINAARYIVTSLNEGVQHTAQSRQSHWDSALSVLDLNRIAVEAGFEVEISWARQFSQAGAFDAVFHREKPANGGQRVLFGFPTDHQERPLHSLTNQPFLHQKKCRLQEQLMEYLQTRLPAYMIPRLITVLDEMPLNDNGKVDRKRLADSAKTKQVRQGLKQQPSTEMERRLRNIWAQVLGIKADDIGVNDSFFRLGGNSIIAMRVVGLARNAGIQLSVADIFRHYTVVDIASQVALSSHPAVEEFGEAVLVDADLREIILMEIASNRIVLDASEVEDVLPLTAFQKQTIENGLRSGHFCNYFFLDLGDCDLDQSRFERACISVLDKHPILRACWLPAQGTYWQVVLRQLASPLRIYDADMETGLQQYYQDFLHRDELAYQTTQPTASFIMLRHEAQGTRLVIRLSHAQYDGTCMQVIIQSLFDAYDGTPMVTAPGFSNFLSYAQARRSKAIGYWKELLQGSSLTSDMSILRPRDDLQFSDPKTIRVKAEVQLPHLPGNITLSCLASAGWAVLLSRITNTSDITYTQLVSGRNARMKGIEQIVGPTLNTVPVRVKIAPHMTASYLLQTCQEQFVSLEEADLLGLQDIQKHCTTWPAGCRPDMMFQHQNIETHPEFKFLGRAIKLEYLERPDTIVPFIYVLCHPLEDGIRLEIMANTHLITTNAADALIGSYAKIVTKLASFPNSQLSAWLDEIAPASY
ncbi:hypothetical protein PWT90_05590 [Aphanocladium album]|nr:hypothetical protein PWT90_05590 [Aphanocladium album]